MYLDLSRHAGQTVLLLQGPVGPFFARFAGCLSAAGVNRVCKVNFNAGDDFFYRGPDIVRFKGSLSGLPEFYRALFAETKPSAVYLFGDCRPVHEEAVRLLKEADIPFYVFEEGYLRPHCVTLEKGGVNARSGLPRHLRPMKKPPPSPLGTEPGIGRGSFGRMALYAFLYFFTGWLHAKKYPLYKHHKPFAAKELWPWMLSYLRKWLYWTPDRITQMKIGKRLHKQYFFVPLQVFCDAQVSHHSDFGDVAGFIETVIASFAEHAPKDKNLVIKHHPMDRGHRRYGRFIRTLAAEKGIAERVFYIHEANLPGLLKHACGTIVINSTVGLSSLHHGTPVKVLGRAFYDIGGLCWQGSLEKFWQYPGKVNRRNWQRFRDFIFAASQITGSFY